jgi:AsmA protein
MAQDGILDVGQVEARLYDGTLKGFLRVDVQGDRPAVTLSTQLSGVQQKPLISDIEGKESQFAGTMSLDTVSPLVCQGNTMHALKRSLSGRVRIAVRDGVFPGVNIMGVVRDSGKKAKDALTSTGAEAGTEKSTKFGSIDATAAINGGVANINDLDFKAPFLRGDGRGTVDLATKHTDYTLHVRVVPSAEGQGGSAGLLGLVVPLRITGPYDNLNYSTDYLRTIGKGALDAVGGVVQGIGNVLTGKKKLF